MRAPVSRRMALMAVLTAIAWSQGTLAQTVRVSGITTFQYVEVRPLVDDSVEAALVAGEGLLRRSEEGHLVRCVGDASYCRFTRSAEAVYTAPAIQDISLSVWGVGRGIRGYARVRGRGVVAGDDGIWPRSNDHYDLPVAYAEIDRGAVRFRGGRQWKTSGLGYYNYDGASVLLRGHTLSLEVYGGWSLARGLNEPRTSETLAAIESFSPEARALLVGAQLSYRPRAGAAVTVLYQREIRDDRLGLYSERTAVDAVVRRGRVSLEGSLEVDLALEQVNEARVRAWLTPWSELGAGFYARRYRPFFELWTIWGAFNPIGFDEYGASAVWRVPGRSSTVEVRASRRAYGETDASSTFGPVRSTGYYVSLSGTTQLNRDWSLQGGYQTDIGFGAAKNDGRLHVRRRLGEGAYVGVGLQAFQRLYEFRVSEGTVFGIGGDAAFRIGPRTRITGSLTTYRHLAGGESLDVDWSQMRGSLRIAWTVGAEPTARPRSGAVR